MATRPPSAINCSTACQFHPDSIGQDKADQLKSWWEAGDSARVLGRKATALLGRNVDHSVFFKHANNHYRELVQEPEPESGDKVGDLQMLDGIIQAAARNSKNWKPTIRDALEAMKLKLQITGNSAFDDMLAAMEGGLSLADGIEEDIVEESVEAVLSPDERPTEDAEDLEEPAIA